MMAIETFGKVFVDLSPADSHFCSSHGATCNGWDPDSCLGQAKTRGICLESAFPYSSAFPGPVCKPVSNHDILSAKPQNLGRIGDVTVMKNWISTRGPCAAVFQVYEDFYSYKSGVYSFVTGNSVGWHCVEVVGFSEIENCWICKNSWGVGWGDHGFFKIAYRQCNIQDYGFWTAASIYNPWK
jgi:C1A family cysteine protease